MRVSYLSPELIGGTSVRASVHIGHDHWPMVTLEVIFFSSFLSNYCEFCVRTCCSVIENTSASMFRWNDCVVKTENKISLSQTTATTLKCNGEQCEHMVFTIRRTLFAMPILHHTIRAVSVSFYVVLCFSIAYCCATQDHSGFHF